MIFKNLFGRKSDEEEWEDLDEEEKSPPRAVGPKDMEVLKTMAVRARGYTDYNKRKIATIIAKLKELDRDILELLPALVHLNIEGLPGFVGEKEHAHGGIVNYDVRTETLKLLQEHFPSATLTPQTIRQSRGKGRIYSLAVMGSLATIAQTPKSDFDMWVCVKKEEFTSEGLSALAFKLREIEAWTEKNRFESHFFITDIDEARANRFGASDSESAGSALGKLLKEEFFRTHSVLAGFPPLWTVMPPNISDEEYERLRALAGHNYHIIDPAKFIDLGNAQRISLEEAFGAALWQMNKALGSPFKSAMKMGLIEDYMDPESGSILLCDRLKETITAIAAQPAKRGEFDSFGPDALLDAHPERLQLDGYLLMFNRILDYYRRKGQGNVEDTLRKCFYLKVGETITGVGDPMRAKSPRKDMVAQLVEAWGWENEKLADLNRFKEWPFDKSVSLGKEINNFIIESYKRLSQSGATSQVRINPTDLTVLGRKLFTFYSRKDNKIDFLPKSFEDSLHQDQLTFSYTAPPPGGAATWKVYRGAVSPNELREAPSEARLLRQTRNLASLLAWLVINEIWDRSTHIGLASKDSPLTVADLQDLLGALLNYFPPVDVGHLPNEDLLKESQTIRAFAILNLGSIRLEEKIQRVDLLWQTSWGEVYYDTLSEKVDQVAALRFCLEHIPRSSAEGGDTFKVFIPSGKTGPSSRQMYVDFEQTILEMAKFFHDPPAPPGTSRTFVLQGERSVSAFTWNGRQIETAQYLNFDEFYLKRESGAFERAELRIASSPTKLLLQQAMVAQHRPDVIQVFIYDDGLKGRVYSSDEMGGTMLWSLSPKAWPAFCARLGLFLENIAKRIAAEPARVRANLPPPQIAFYHIEARGSQRDQFRAVEATEKYAGTGKLRAEVQGVFEEATPDGRRVLLFKTEGASFSTAEHGAEIFQVVASHIFDARERKSKGHICVADLDLPLSYRQKNCPGGAKTTHYLTYRKLVEGKLNQALQAL